MAVIGVPKNVTHPNTFYMERYKNLGGDSGVYAFEIGADYIEVEFRKGGVYLYTYGSAGQSNIEQMKRLARQGQGLGSFINTHVRTNYARKTR